MSITVFKQGGPSQIRTFPIKGAAMDDGSLIVKSSHKWPHYRVLLSDHRFWRHDKSQSGLKSHLPKVREFSSFDDAVAARIEAGATKVVKVEVEK